MRWVRWVKWQLEQIVCGSGCRQATQRENHLLAVTWSTSGLWVLSVSLDRFGWTFILLRLFLVLFFSSRWDAGVSICSDSSRPLCWVSVHWPLSLQNDSVSEDRRIGTCQREECEGPNLPLLLAVPWLSCTFALMFNSQSAMAAGVGEADGRWSYLWIYFTDTPMIPVLSVLHVASVPHIRNNCYTGTDTHIVTLSLVEPLSSSPLTALHSLHTDNR